MLYSQSIYSVDIIINNGSIKKNKYSVLNISDKDFIKCHKFEKNLGQNIHYKCLLPQNTFISDTQKYDYDFVTLKLSTIKNRKYLFITPKTEHSSMHAISGNTFQKEKQYLANKDGSKQWSFFFSQNEENHILKEYKENIGLNFNLYPRAFRPFIGSLDENKKPLLSNISDNAEFNALMEVKNLYNDKQYILSNENIRKFLKLHPKSIFKKNFLLYSLRNYYKMNKEELASRSVDIALSWLKENPSDTNIPEVLFYLGSAYTKLHKREASIRVFKELIINYKENKFSEHAKLKLGDNMFDQSNINLSIKLYEEVLYNTKNLDIALLASEKIASKSLAVGMIEKAKYHYGKIMQNNIDFLTKDITKAQVLAEKLIINKLDELALKILLDILNKTSPEAFPEQYSNILLKIARLFAPIDANKAIDRYRQYIKMFPKSLNINTVRQELDNLIFQNAKQQKLSEAEILKNIEYLMKKYKGEPIAERAFYKKVKIYFKNKKFSYILENEQRLLDLSNKTAPDKLKILQVAKHDYIIQLLEHKDCDAFVVMKKKYSKIKISKKYNDVAFLCFYDQFQYKEAKKITEEELEKPEQQYPMKWTYRLAKLLIKNLDYKNMIPVITDLLTLVDLKKSDNILYKNTIYNLFDAYQKTNNTEEMKKLALKIKTDYKGNIKNMAVFKKMIQLAIPTFDTLAVSHYASELIQLSKKYNMYTESPWVEFTLYDAYTKTERVTKAIKVLKDLNDYKDKVENVSVSKIKYHLSEAYRIMKDFKKEERYLRECIFDNDSKTWVQICKNIMQWL